MDMLRHDVTDQQWARIAAHLPAERGRQGRPVLLRNRQFMHAIRYFAKTGLPWRDLPPEFGPWKTVYHRFSSWSKAGVFDELLRVLSQDSDCENVMVDGTYIRAHQHAAGGLGGPKKNEIGLSRGGLTTKIHALVDGLGNPLHVHLSAGNIHDITEAPKLLAVAHGRNFIADKGYDSDAVRAAVRAKRMTPVIPSKRNRLVPAQIDKLVYKERHLVENFFCKLKVFRRIATRYDKTAIHFLGLVTLVSCWIQLA